MNDHEFDQMLNRLMTQDFSVGTDTFRDDLLARCKAVLDTEDEGTYIDDDSLELLAAAGDSFAGLGRTTPEP